MVDESDRSPLERAARALFRHEPLAWEGAVEEGLSQGAWREYLDDVKIVLQAIREPSEAMADAGGDRNKLGWDPAPEAVWRAMIDAARKEG